LKTKTVLLAIFLLVVGIFQVAAAAPVKYPASPAKGFSYPYYLVVPPGVDTPSVIVVEPNNTGTTDDSFAVHDVAASNLITSRIPFAGDMRSPFLVPVFPRPSSNWWVYAQALDRDCFTTSNTALQHLDTQLLAMIADARSRLGTLGLSTDSKVFIMGFSASGMFANRFTALHPGSIKAAAVGSPGGWPLAPIATYSGENLRYNVGIYDVGALTGTNFNLSAFAAVPQYFFIGDQDVNDSVPYTDSYDPVDADQVNRLFGTTPMQRWPVAHTIYTNAGCTNAQFVTYPGIGHTFTAQMQDDIKHFFYPARHFLKRGVHAELSVGLNTNNVRVDWASLSGLTYHVEGSSNLAGWFPEGVSNYMGDGFYQTYQTGLSNRPAKYFRLRSEYIPQGGGQGRIFFFNPTYGAGAFTVTCSGLSSGSCQTTIAGPGSFTYSEPTSSQASLVVNLSGGGQASFSLTISNATSGTFQGAYVNGSVTNLFGGGYETLRTP
jgi:hypothetical protein